MSRPNTHDAWNRSWEVARNSDSFGVVRRVVFDSLSGFALPEVPAHVAAASTLEPVGDALERLRVK